MSVIGSNVLAGASGQSAGGGGGGGGGGAAISRSLRFNPGDSAYLNRTPSSSGNLRTWTWSGWVKRSNSGAGHTNDFFSCGVNIHNGGAGGAQANAYFDVDGTMQVYEYSGGYGYNYRTTQVFRDFSAWYHIVISLDTTNSTAGDRVKIYINGDRVTSFSTSDAPALNFEGEINKSGVQHYISDTAAPFNGYLADVHFIDGQALAPTDFGETNTNNLWVPKAYAGTYGPLVNQAQNWTNATTLSTGSWTGALANMFDGSLATAAYDSVSGATATITLSQSYSGLVRVYNGTMIGTVVLKNGSTTVATYTGLNTGVGWETVATSASSFNKIEITSSSGSVIALHGIEIGGNLLVDSGVTVTDNSFRLDFADNSSNAALGTDTSGNSNTWTVNNLSAGAGSNPTAKQNFDVVTYTGTGSTQSISSLAFQPDFVWIKNRGSALNYHILDSVRGAQNVIVSNTTDAEFSSSGSLASFNTNGFTVGSNSNVNGNGNNIVAYCWKAGGAASSNTDGTITSQVSVNTSYGFSVTSWVSDGSNATVGTGLSSVDFIILKCTSNATNWAVWSSAYASNTGYLALDLDNALVSDSTVFSGAPTGGVVPLGGNGNYGTKSIMYAWSEVAEFSKIGSYSGNGSTTGPIITTGFKPRFLLIKRADSASNWRLFDTKRDPSNPADTLLFPDSAEVEYTSSTYNTDLLSDGFQLKNTHSGLNASGGTYIYMAFAETIPADPDGDSLVDTPTNGDTASDTGAGGEITGCYATLNPLAGGAPTNGNLHQPNNSAINYATIGVSSGKWYFETTIDTQTAGGVKIGVAQAFNTGEIGDSSTGWAILGQSNTDGGKGVHAGTLTSSYTTYAQGDIVNCAFDMDSGKIYWGKNGTWLNSGNPATGAGAIYSNVSGTVFPAATANQGGALTWNFGQRAFAYPLSGYKSLNTANLSSTIADGSLYFDTKLYTGDGQSSKAVTGYNFSPDFLWIKERSSTSDHGLWNTVVGSGNYLSSNATAAEVTTTTELSSIDSAGFTVGSSGMTNQSSQTYAAWAWDAGTSNTPIAAGGLNSSSYDQSQTWSTYGTFTGTVHNDYDWSGVFSASDHYGPDGSMYLSSGTGKWTLTSSIACNSSVKFYVYGSISFTINEGLSDETTQASTGGNAFHYFTIPFSGNIASIKVNTSAVYLMRIFVDGAALIDSGITLGGTGVPNVPSIASTVRANPSAGFSIVTYTGTGSALTVGHGLNAAPEFLIVKNRTSAASWFVYHKSIGATKYLKLETTDAEATGGLWSNTDPTSSVVFSSGASTGSSGQDYLMLAFAPVEGYSAMGKYTGNGNASGPMVYTSMRPKLVLIKRTDATSAWRLFDTERSSYNVVSNLLQPNDSAAELTGTYIDILSNGFKIRTTNVNYNASGGTFIWAAFAEHPFASNGGLAR